MVSVREIEKVVKGFSNHNRIKILLVLEKQPDLTLYDIAEKVNGDFRNVSEHSRKLLAGGLITKKYKGQFVEHKLTTRGHEALKFCKMIK